MASLDVRMEREGEGRRFTVDGRSYRLSGAEQRDYLDFYAALARDFGTRLPRNRQDAPPSDFSAPFRPLLTANLTPDILYGYGDPAALWVPEEGAWYVVVTSNDAPNSFPILRSPDLERWETAGFVFPERAKPRWTAEGFHVGDYWAPELSRVGGRYVLCFSARAQDGSLAVGLATAANPAGPYTPSERPLIEGGVIDAHIFVSAAGEPILFWKEDSNGVWPALLLLDLLAREPLALELFPDEADRRTAAFLEPLQPSIGQLPPMEQFFILQPLIEAALDDFAGLRDRLGRTGRPEAERILAAMRTPIFAQRLSPELELEGEAATVLVNDLDWEGHLIEGPWLTEQQGRYWLFYAGNDFSTAEYGIGYAVADTPFGPYRKSARPLLRSTPDWAGPGHPSIAAGPDGVPRMFLHAFFPGRAGYKEFRALLTARLRFTEDRVELF